MGSLRCSVDLCSAQRYRLFRSVCGARSSGPGGTVSVSMEKARLTPFPKEQAATRVCNVSSFATELLEIRSKDPSFHVLVIPGNPGIVAFYKDFIEALYDNLGGQASITGFTAVDSGCCGLGQNRGQVTCLPFVVPCDDRGEYVFWDAYHPTQAANLVLAQRAFNGTQDHVYPVNLQQLAKL